MRFYEYESRRIVERAGIPVTKYGFCTTADEARKAAEEIGGPTVIKSQVLTGGRMKAGGVKFADTPDEAAEHAAAILELEIGGHMPVGVLVDPKAEVAHEYYAAVLWDGRAKRPMMLFSDMGGIDIEQVASEHPDHVGRGHLSNLHPIADFEAKQTVARCGMTGSQLNRATAVLARLARLQRDYDVTLAEINPLARLADGSFVALDAHMEMEDEAVGRHRKTLGEIGVARLSSDPLTPVWAITCFAWKSEIGSRLEMWPRPTWSGCFSATSSMSIPPMSLNSISGRFAVPSQTTLA